MLKKLQIVIAVMIAKYLLPDLYHTKMKNALFLARESNRLSCACAVYVPIRSHPPIEQQEQITLLEGGKL